MSTESHSAPTVTATNPNVANKNAMGLSENIMVLAQDDSAPTVTPEQEIVCAEWKRTGQNCKEFVGAVHKCSALIASTDSNVATLTRVRDEMRESVECTKHGGYNAQELKRRIRLWLDVLTAALPAEEHK